MLQETKCELARLRAERSALEFRLDRKSRVGACISARIKTTEHIRFLEIGKMEILFYFFLTRHSFIVCSLECRCFRNQKANSLACAPNGLHSSPSCKRTILVFVDRCSGTRVVTIVNTRKFDVILIFFSFGWFPIDAVFPHRCYGFALMRFLLDVYCVLRGSESRTYDMNLQNEFIILKQSTAGVDAGFVMSTKRCKVVCINNSWCSLNSPCKIRIEQTLCMVCAP